MNRKTSLFLLCCMLLCACSKRDKLPDGQPDFFTNVTQWDRLPFKIYTTYLPQEPETPVLDTLFTYFSYNAQGLPVKRKGLVYTGSSGYRFSYNIYDTITYLDHETIKLSRNGIGEYNFKDHDIRYITVSKGLVRKIIKISSYNPPWANDTLELFYDHGNIIREKQIFVGNTTTTTYKRNEQNNVTGLESFTYNHQNRLLERAVETREYTSKPNPYYKQEWLRLWDDLYNWPLSPFLMNRLTRVTYDSEGRQTSAYTIWQDEE